MRKRRREDLAVAHRLSDEYALGEVCGVTRSRAERPTRDGLVGFASRMVIAGGFGFALSIVLLVVAAVLKWPPLVDIALVGALGVLGVGYYAGGIMLNHSFAPGTETDRVFWFADGLAHLITAEPEPRVLRWSDVDSVTATLLDEALQHYGWYYTCTLRGRTGTEITLTGYDKATVGNSLGRRLVNEAERILSPRLVPPLIEAYESGEPAVIGGWTVDRTGISANASGFVTESCPWAEITRITMERKPSRTGPIEQIHIYTGRRQRTTLDIGVSDIPNAVFLPALIAHAGVSNGIDVQGGPPERPPLPSGGHEPELPAQPG